MLTLADIREYIKGFGVGSYFSTGKIDARKEKSIGIYQRPEYTKANIMLGGLPTTKTQVKRVSILLHWNKNAVETESNAWELYYDLLTASNVEINGNSLKYIEIKMPEPADLGTDDNGIYERAIWADFYYEE